MTANPTAWHQGWAKAVFEQLSKRKPARCPRCKGTGEIMEQTRNGEFPEDCPKCEGKGVYLPSSGEALYDHAILDRFKECQTWDVAPCSELIELLEFRLLRGHKPRQREHRTVRWQMAAKFRAMHPEGNYRDLIAAVRRATGLKIALSTLNDWMNDVEFQNEVSVWSGIADRMKADGFSQEYQKRFVDPFK